MATVTGLTAARMIAIEAGSIVDGEINGAGHLILTKHDGTEIDAGSALVAVPAVNLVDILDGDVFTQASPPEAYPEGISLMHLTSTQVTAGGWTNFTDKYGTIRTIKTGANEIAQIWMHHHDASAESEMWIRGGNWNGWGAWRKLATTNYTDAAVAALMITTAKLVDEAVTTEKIADDSITSFKIQNANVHPIHQSSNDASVNIISDYNFANTAWRLKRLGTIVSGYPATNGTWAFSTTGMSTGSYKAVSTLTADDQKMILTGPFPVVPGDMYEFSIDVHTDTLLAHANANLGVRWYDAGGTNSTVAVVPITTRPGTFTTFTGTWTVPAGARLALVHLHILGGSASPSGSWNFAYPIVRRLVTTGWVAPTLTNSWVNYGDVFAPIGYRMQAGKIVRLRGLMKSGTVNAGGTAPAFTLPAGYRPEYQQLFIVMTGSNTLGRVDVKTNGEVFVAVGNNAFVALDNISFVATQ